MKLTPLHEKKTLRKLIVVRVMISDKKRSVYRKQVNIGTRDVIESYAAHKFALSKVVRTLHY